MNFLQQLFAPGVPIPSLGDATPSTSLNQEAPLIQLPQQSTMPDVPKQQWNPIDMSVFGEGDGMSFFPTTVNPKANAQATQSPARRFAPDEDA